MDQQASKYYFTSMHPIPLSLPVSISVHPDLQVLHEYFLVYVLLLSMFSISLNLSGGCPLFFRSDFLIDAASSITSFLLSTVLIIFVSVLSLSCQSEVVFFSSCCVFFGQTNVFSSSLLWFTDLVFCPGVLCCCACTEIFFRYVKGSSTNSTSVYCSSGASSSINRTSRLTIIFSMLWFNNRYAFDPGSYPINITLVALESSFLRLLR